MRNNGSKQPNRARNVAFVVCGNLDQPHDSDLSKTTKIPPAFSLMSAAIPKTMRAWVQREAGNALEKSVLVEDHPVPVPKAGEVLIQVCSAGVNPIDWKVVEVPTFAAGIKCFSTTGYTGGCDGAGIVAAVGDGVTRVKPGDRVYFQGSIMGGAGSYAEYSCVGDVAVERFDAAATGWTLADAGTLGCALWTATQSLYFALNITKNDTVFINGGSGGVGVFALQLAREQGAKIITTCSGRNAEFVRTLIAPTDHIIDYTNEDVVKRVMEITGGKGVTQILDTVSDNETSAALIFGVAAFNARAAVLLPVQVNAGMFFAKNIHISFIYWGGLVNADPALGRAIIDKCTQICSGGKIKIPIPAGNRFPLAKLNDAIALNKTGRTQGKALIEINAALSA